MLASHLFHARTAPAGNSTPLFILPRTPLTPTYCAIVTYGTLAAHSHVIDLVPVPEQPPPRLSSVQCLPQGGARSTGAAVRPCCAPRGRARRASAPQWRAETPAVIARPRHGSPTVLRGCGDAGGKAGAAPRRGGAQRVDLRGAVGARPQRPRLPAPAAQTTLVELLQALQADGSGVALAVACGSRDALDAVTAALAACGTFSLAVLVGFGPREECRRVGAAAGHRAVGLTQSQGPRNPCPPGVAVRSRCRPWGACQRQHPTPACCAPSCPAARRPHNARGRAPGGAGEGAPVCRTAAATG